MTKKFSFTKWEGVKEVGVGEELPMSKKLKPNQYIVLSAIAMFQGRGGICDATQQQLSEVLPYSREVIGKVLETLVEFRYEGKPVLERSERVGQNGRVQWVYRLLPNPLFGVYGESWCEESSHHTNSWCEESSHTKEEQVITKNKRIKELEEPSMKNKKMTKKEIVSHFKHLLEDKGIESKFSYPQVYGKMKNQGIDDMLSDLKNNEIKRVCEIIVEEYGHGQIKSNLSQYPLNIQVITRKWVVEKAVQLLKQEKEQKSQLEEQVVVADKRQDKAIQSIMDRIKGRK